MTKKSPYRKQRDAQGQMPQAHPPKPTPPVPGLFFHLRRCWLSMAYAGLMGEQNQIKAQYHVQQWIDHQRAVLLTGNETTIKATTSTE